MNPESWTKKLSGFYYVTKEEQTHIRRSTEVHEDVGEGLQYQLHQRALWHQRQIAAVPMEKVPGGRADSRVEEEELQLYS